MADSTTVTAHPQPSEKGFVRAIGLFDGTMIVVGSMIGSGIFIVAADITRQTGSAGGLLLTWVLTGLSDDYRCPVVWRTGGDVSARWRAIHLSAGSVFAAVGFPLRLDVVSGDPERHDRRGGCRICALSWCVVSGRLAEDLDRGAYCAGFEIRDQSFGTAVSGYYFGSVSDVSEYSRRSAGKINPEYFYHRQNTGAGQSDFPGDFCWSQSCRDCRQFFSSLGDSQSGGDRAGYRFFPRISSDDHGRQWGIRLAGGFRRCASRVAVFFGRLE